MRLYSLAVMLIVLICSNATAQLADRLRITEVMWDSSHPGQDESDEGGHANGDWWELLNASDTPIEMTGFMWDDDDRLEGFDFTVFPSFTIQPSEAIIIVREEASSVEFEDGFRAAWNLPTNMRVLGETFFENTNSGDTFSGLSAGGDEVNLYDASGELIQRVVLGAAETGRSLEWGFEGNQFAELGLAVEGEFGAFEAISDGSGEVLANPNYIPFALDVASPGVVFGFDVVFPTSEPRDIDAVCLAVVNGELTEADLTTVLSEQNILPGDADQDGAVDFDDFVVLANNFGASGVSFSGADFDCTGTVDFDDFVILANHFGQQPNAQAASVPEPTCFWLLPCLAMQRLIAIKRRRTVQQRYRLSAS